jgi:2-polyprenyl-3-methyl-5-hydroxy-6-metoxy-1,4-benzoquinol methylase
MNYENKTSDYFTNIRKDLVSMIEHKKGLKVLEVGAGFGETLFYLKKQGIASEAIGLDIFEDVGKKDQYKNIDGFIFGSIEELDLPQFNEYFDVILLADVLEHLIEPGLVLEKLKKYLKPNGEILVSMPNIRHYSAFIKIFIKGNFDYEESGLFDYTHRRFFCRKNIRNLLESNFEVKKEASSLEFYEGRSGAKVFNTLTLGVFEEFLSIQYLYKVNK